MVQPNYAIEISNLKKTYCNSTGQQKIEALKDINLQVPRGSFCALLGPNGAGKSTLINILAGLTVKSSGVVKVWGFDIHDQMKEAKRSIGVVPQELNIDPFFTPREVLELQAGLYGIRKSSRITQKIINAVGLNEKADAYSRSLSGGMRRRLLVGKAMVHSPPILVLDEPSAGVDVELRQKLWQYIKKLSENGTTVLLTTHYLEEAEALCDTIGIINCGELVAFEKTPDLLSRLDSKELTIVLDENLKEIPIQLKPLNPVLIEGRYLVFSYAPSKLQAGENINFIKQCNLSICDIMSKEVDLEDIFVKLTRPL